MATIDEAIIFLSKKGIDAFEEKGMLVIPIPSPDQLEGLVTKFKGYLNEIGYNKSWAIWPHSYEVEKTEE